MLPDYLVPLYRPPSEADSLIFQVAYGCPNNTCAFCAMYKERRYRERPLDEVLAEIRKMAGLHKDVNRVFLADGDAFRLPFPKLEAILVELNQCLPGLVRVGTYANGSSIAGKNDHELARLRELKLGIAYMGLESGSQAVLNIMHKRESVADMVEAARRTRDAGIKLSVMVLLGLGGRQGSRDHALATAVALNRMQPRFVSTLTVIPERGTLLLHWVRKGRFQPLNTQEILEELKLLISHLELDATVFRCNHASNPVPLSARLSREKVQLLQDIEAVLDVIKRQK